MVEEVEEMPWEAEYPARVTAGLLRYGKDTLKYTQSFYTVRNRKGELILSAGVAVWSFVRPPELWVLLAKPYFINLRDSLRETRDAMVLPIAQYPNLVCEVEQSSAVELHFVKHMGWKQSAHRSLRPDGEAYIQFEVK